MRDPYKILNIRGDAEQEVIAAAYKALARKYHPDVSKLDAERMKEINWAYELLRHEKQRVAWDRTQATQGQPTSHPSDQKQSGSKEDDREKDPIRTKHYRRRETSRNSSRPKGDYVLQKSVFIWIMGILGTIVVIYTLQVNQVGFSPIPSSTIVPTNTSSPILTQPPTRAPTPTLPSLSEEGCIEWSAISDTHNEENTCVFGFIADVILPGQPIFEFFQDVGSPTNVPNVTKTYYVFFGQDFETNNNDFKLQSFSGKYFEDLSIGNCISITGKVRDYGSFYYIDPFSSANPAEVHSHSNPEICR